MDPPPKKQQPTAAAASRPATTKPTTLLDAYEVECIKREMERLLLGQKNAAVDDDDCAEAASSDAVAGQTHILGRRQNHRSSKNITSTAKNANPTPVPAPRAAKKRAGGRAWLLGRHAVAICCGAATVASAGAAGRSRRRRRGGYREVEKV